MTFKKRNLSKERIFYFSKKWYQYQANVQNHPKECMKLELIIKCPIGPVEASETEFTVIKEVTEEEYIRLLNNPDCIVNIKVLEI